MTLAELVPRIAPWLVGAQLLHHNNRVRTELHDYVQQHVRGQSDLGRQYTAMMICIATNLTPMTTFCAKPNSPLNKWSPGPYTTCEDLICNWNCNRRHTRGYGSLGGHPVLLPHVSEGLRR